MWVDIPKTNVLKTGQTEVRWSQKNKWPSNMFNSCEYNFKNKIEFISTLDIPLGIIAI